MPMSVAAIARPRRKDLRIPAQRPLSGRMPDKRLVNVRNGAVDDSHAMEKGLRASEWRTLPFATPRGDSAHVDSYRSPSQGIYG